MKLIELHSNKYPNLSATVDDEDYELATAYRWNVAKIENKFYAVTSVRCDHGQTSLLMHKLLTGYAINDHVNGDGLDNRRVNLREATTAQNGQNRGPQANNTSGLKGVSWHKLSGKWNASIKASGKRMNLGYFTSKIAAAEAYDAAAREYHGVFAYLNFPEGVS